MSLEQRWQIYQQAGYVAATATPPANALDAWYLAVLAFGQQDWTAATTYAQYAAHEQPHNLVFRHAALYLASLSQRDKPNVYTMSDGFTAFIRGGGNIPLYAATSAALHRIYAQYSRLSLLDIGAGNGRALLPALSSAVHRLDVVEPAAALLDELKARLAEYGGMEQRLWNSTLQTWSHTTDDEWDLAQATYSLQSLPPDELAGMLRWLRQHTRRLIIVEFDVPDFSHMYAPERVQHMLARYEQGLAEYVDSGDLVAQGFLMPVLFGYFDPTAARTNYERPLAEWVRLCQQAGFGTVETQQLYTYWWAPAALIDAH